MALRQHYWNPRTNEACFVDETQLIYAFNERQDAGTWSDLHVHPDWGELLFVATHSETLEPMVVYRALYGERGLWVRPAAMWDEQIERDGQVVRRFTYIGD